MLRYGLSCAALRGCISRALHLNSKYLKNSSSTKGYEFSSSLQSLLDSSRSLTRSWNVNAKSYLPPPDVEDKIFLIYKKLYSAQVEDWKNYTFSNNSERYKVVFQIIIQNLKFFVACMNEFKHSILNSYLHQLNTPHDLIKYYSTPVKEADFLHQMTNDSKEKMIDLPKNLQIQTDPVRYNPHTDMFFNGNAYWGRSTIVSNLAASKKYSGFRVHRHKRIRVIHEGN